MRLDSSHLSEINFTCNQADLADRGYRDKYHSCGMFQTSCTDHHLMMTICWTTLQAYRELASDCAHARA